MTLQITIIGLDQIGTSIGLALASHKDLVTRVGSDREPAIAHRAEKLGAVDHITFNLPAAVRNADLVILDIPVDDLEDTLKVITKDLKEGAVVIDTSPVKTAVAEWAKQILSTENYFVAWTPSLNAAYLRETNLGLDAAHADLFQNSLIYITAPLGTPGQALKLASDLTTLVGATPMFADPYEVDGLIAANHLLPALTAAALFNTIQDQPGWREGKRLAGKTLAEASAPILHPNEREAFGQAALLNQENVLRMIDNYITSLMSLRELIKEQNAKELQTMLKHALEGKQEWLRERQEAPWINGEKSTFDTPTAGDILGRLIGLGGNKKKNR